MPTSFARIPILILAAALSACADPTAAPLATSAPGTAAAEIPEDAAQNQLLATIREATARYHSLDAALTDGYVEASACEAIPEGGIGVHYRKSSLFDVVVDPAQPELLVYEPQQNGDRRLVAVAFVVPAAPWDAIHSGPPTLGEQTFEDKRVPDWSSPPFPTYELHVWVWQHNPIGIYATINPTVGCEFAA